MEMKCRDSSNHKHLNHLRSSRRGQVTLFIITGLLILLFVSLIIYYRQVVLQEPEVIDPEIQPIKNYYETCLAELGEDAIRIAGDQSGYIEIPEAIELNKAYVSLTPTGLFKRPYWYFEGTSQIPSIDLMQEQISAHIISNLPTCLDDFVPFTDQFVISEREEPELTTVIAEDDVVVSSTHLIRVQNILQDETTHLERFEARLPVRLHQAYDLGRRIVQEENRDMFLENITIDLMAAHPEIPFTGLTFHCSRERWNLNVIEDELRTMLRQEIPKLRIKNTDYAPFLADAAVYEELSEYDIEDIAAGTVPDYKPADAYEYFHYLIDVKATPTDLRAGFAFDPEHETKLNARPRDGPILESDSGQAPTRYLRFLCLNFHHFTYDVEYPVQVMINDETAFAGTGFVFRFMLPVHIKKNQGNRVDFGLDVFENVRSLHISGPCEQLAGPIYDIRAFAYENDIEVEQPGVNISYDCIQAACELGQTTLDSGIYRLRTQLPTYCGSGFIVARKAGYLESREQVLDSTDLDLDIRKIKEVGFSAVKHVVTDTSVQDAADIPNNHKVLISIQNRDYPNLVSFVEYPNDANAAIQLVEDDSTYALDILFVDDLDNVILGGYKGDWDVSLEEVQDAETIIFHVAEIAPRPLNESMIYDVLYFLQENDNYKSELEPELR